ncbi:MAG: hypothetical protein ABIT05_11715 [Chitinophagaceae bacterium]
MNNQLRKLSKFRGKSLINILIVGILLPVYSFAQTKNVTPKPKKIYWYMEFSVTIQGNGKQTSDDEDDLIEWEVDRSYSGIIELNDSMSFYKPGLNAQEHDEAIKTKRFSAFHNIPSNGPKNYMLLNVRIHDRYNITTLDGDEGDSFENTTIKKTWKYSSPQEGGKVYAANAVQLSIDNKLRTYNVFIPILPADNSISFASLSVDTVIDRSEMGYGDAPTHEEKSGPESYVLLHSIGMPSVTGLIQNGAIQHIPNDFLFPANFNTAWGYDSFDDLPDLHPEKPIFPDVPDSKTLVKIRVEYRFSKKPF